MRELKFDGLSPDGTRLVLAGNDGQKWSVVIDERIEAAVRRDRARMAQVEIEQAGVLRPREIQARIRSGATAEDVAASSGLPIEHIRRFEGPVLTERSWVAQQAQSTEVRRPGGDVELGDLVAERLQAAGVDPTDIAWDAWRRDDGIWVVIATFPIEPNTHVATWSYDSGSRTMTVADDNARSLSAIDPDVPLQLSAARPALASVAAPEPEGDEHAEHPPAIITALRGWRDDAREVDADEPSDAGESSPDASVADADDAGRGADPEDDVEAWALEADSIDLDAEPEAAVDPGLGAGDSDLDDQDTADLEDQGDDGAQDASDPEAIEQPVGPTSDAEDVPLFDAEPTATPPRSGGRASIPSFDDILFGPGPNAQ